MAAGSRLGFIGCGQMARALLGGFARQHDLLASVSLFDIDAAKSGALAREFGLAVVDSGTALAQDSELVVLAVKPPAVAAVLRQIAPVLDENKVVISIAAGITLDAIQAETGPRVPAVRVMPNLPCLIGQGIMGLSFSLAVTEVKRELILNLFSAVGQVESVAETYMDGITVVSGSGPAFLFLVAEALTDAGVDIGLPRDLARRLVEQTLTGSSIMLQQSGEHPAVLRERVTSPGGTTIAGLRALEKGGLRAAFFDAIKEAYQRAAQR